MGFVCPACQEARVRVAGFTDDALTKLTCELCDHAWIHGQGARAQVPRRRAVPYAEAFAEFSAHDDVPGDVRERVERLKDEFLADRPEPEPGVAMFWERYQQVFSAAGLPEADPSELKFFANTNVGAGPGNMSVFNKAWNDLGDAAAADRVRGAVDYLLRGPEDVPLEDRLTELIDPEGPRGMTGFRESLLTKVLCVMEPTRYLPILVYTSDAGGKREIARSVFGLELPAPEATAQTRGRLALWSNELLIRLLGDGFRDLQHGSQFLWWAKDRPLATSVATT